MHLASIAYIIVPMFNLRKATIGSGITCIQYYPSIITLCDTDVRPSKPWLWSSVRFVQTEFGIHVLVVPVVVRLLHCGYPHPKADDDVSSIVIAVSEFVPQMFAKLQRCVATPPSNTKFNTIHNCA